MTKEEETSTEEESQEDSVEQPIEIIEETFVPNLRSTLEAINPGLEELDNSPVSLEGRTTQFIDEEKDENQPKAGIYDINKSQNPGLNSTSYDNQGNSSYDIGPAGQDAYSASPNHFNQPPS